MAVELLDRNQKLTDAEFARLSRSSEGRIVDDFDFVWIWATDAQKRRMHGDDQSRGSDLDEELAIMRDGLGAEFG